MDLVEFLRARLDEDERAAKAAGGNEWHQPDPVREHGRIEDAAGEVVTYDESSPTEGQAEHIARHDPARVLAEVDAKRRRLERHHPVHADDIDWVACSHCHTTWPCPDIRDDLSVYAAHPDYDESWRP